MTLSHGDDFEMSLSQGGFSGYNTVGNTTTVVIVNNESNILFTSKGDYEIVDIKAGTTGNVALETDVVTIPTVFGLGDAYPNPFNPTTSFELAIPSDGFVSVKVYNVTGQAIATIHEGQLAANSYTFAWDASNASSGMYFLKAEAAENMDVQKIMLLK